jgi:hypothetical protein
VGVTLVKLQQYYIYKINTHHLKRNNYNINLTIEEARKSGWIISIADSQMLRSLRYVKGEEIDASDKINYLLSEQRRIKKLDSNRNNSEILYKLANDLDNILFVPEIISVVVDDMRHYNDIGKNGFICNGKKYRRFICGSGQARRNNALFIDEDYYESLYKILDNNRNADVPITPAKYSAYFGLFSSSSQPVSTPYFCVIPDHIVKRTEMVDYIEEVAEGDDTVTACEKEIEFNLFDGQGLISPRLAKQWAEELELDYMPSHFIIRSAFIKGMVCVIDFHRFSDEIGIHIAEDIYGNKVNIRDMDVILTQSQFKLSSSYSSLEEYKTSSKNNQLGWGITRVSPKYENKHCFMNYQFLQVLNLDDEQIEAIAQPTIDYFNNVIHDDIDYTLLYLLGKNADQYDPDLFDKLHDNVTKALILNNKLIEDPFIKNHLVRSLNKKIKQSYIGNLLVDGQYTMMVSDPYALMQHVFNLPITGLLKRDEYYNQYWLNKNVDTVAAMRAPLTWRSEVNILKQVRNEEMDDWYQYLNSCQIYNVFGNDCMIHGGSDQDGDLVCTTNNQQIINGAYGGLPIYYDTKKVAKEIINKDTLYLFDTNGFNQKIGFVTNCETSGFGLLPLFEEGSQEHAEMIKRLKCFRKEQGANIDATKGLVIKPFPFHWTKWKSIPEDATDEEKQEIEFQNRIVINKRPLFMRWLYTSYNKKYQDFRERFDNRAVMRFNTTLDHILQGDNLSEEEIALRDAYKKYNPFIETDCLMNKICWHMEKSVKQLKEGMNKNAPEYIVDLLQNKYVKTNKNNIKLLYDLYLEYKKEKRNFATIVDDSGTNKYKTIEQYHKHIRQKAYSIINNGAELANIAVDICYKIHPNDNKSFAWNVFGKEIVDNIKENRQDNCFMLKDDKYGEIEFLGGRYSRVEIDFGEEYDGYDM